MKYSRFKVIFLRLTKTRMQSSALSSIARTAEARAMSTTALTSENQKQWSSSPNYLYISAPGSAPRAMATQLKRWQKTHPENVSSQETLLLHSLWHSPSSSHGARAFIQIKITRNKLYTAFLKNEILQAIYHFDPLKWVLMCFPLLCQNISFKSLK